MQRREFLKNGCALCIGGTALISFLESCQHIPIYNTVSENKQLRIPLSQFGKENFLIVKPTDKRFDVVVIKSGETEYRSFVMICTHAENQLEFNGKEFRCSVHGSVFNSFGKVEKGPAERALTGLVSKIENNNLLVMLQ